MNSIGSSESEHEDDNDGDGKIARCTSTNAVQIIIFTSSGLWLSKFQNENLMV